MDIHKVDGMCAHTSKDICNLVVEELWKRNGEVNQKDGKSGQVINHTIP
jgi:hypothetical protein